MEFTFESLNFVVLRIDLIVETSCYMFDRFLRVLNKKLNLATTSTSNPTKSKPLQTSSEVFFDVPAVFCEIEVMTTTYRPTKMSFAELGADSRCWSSFVC
jgi:hypothetical protein